MAKFKNTESLIKAVRAMTDEDVKRIETKRWQEEEQQRRFTANRNAERELIVKNEQAKIAPYYEEFYKQQEIKKNGGAIDSTFSDLSGIKNPKKISEYVVDNIKGLGLQEFSKLMSMNADAIKYASPHNQQLLGLNNQNDVNSYIDATDAVSNKYRVDSNETFENSTDGWQENHKMLGQVGNTFTRMLPNIAAQALAGPLGGVTSVYAGQKANKQNELIDRGIDRNQAELRGTFSGAVEMAVEASPIGSLGRFGDLIKVGSNGVKKIVRDVLLGATGEATEEGITYIADYILDKAFKDPEANFDTGELTETMKMAFITGGILDSSGIAINKISNKLQTAKLPFNEPKPIPINNQVIADTDTQVLPTMGVVHSDLKKVSSQILSDDIKQEVQGHLPMNKNFVVEKLGQEQFDYIQDLSVKTKVPIDFITANNTMNGYYKDGRITLNLNSSDPMTTIWKHELTHHLESSNLYNDLQEVVTNEIGQDYNNDVQSLATNIIRDYAERGVQLNEIEAKRELVAKYVEEKLFKDRNSINRLALNKPNVFKRIYDWLADTIKSMRSTPKQRELMKIEKMYRDVLRNTPENFIQTGKVKFDIKEDSRGKYVDIDKNTSLDGLSKKEGIEKVKEALKSLIGVQFTIDENGKVVILDKTMPGKYTYPGGKKVKSNDYWNKLKVANYIDEIIKIAQYQKSEIDVKNHPFAKDGFDYYTTRFKGKNLKGDDIFYNALLNIGKNKEVFTFYDLNNIKEETPALGANASPIGPRVSSTSILNPISENVKKTKLLLDESYNDKKDSSYSMGGEISDYDYSIDEYKSQTHNIEQGKESKISNEENSKRSQKIIHYENKNFTNFSKYLQHNFGLSRKDVNTILKNDVLTLKDSIQKTGKISSSQANEIFKKAWEFGLTRDTTMHDLYPELNDWLKSSKLNYDAARRALGQGAFDDYRYEARGLLNFSKDGGNIDSLYNELSSEYPDLFDSSINNEADQLNTMLDVASELQVTETPLKNSNLKQYQSGYAEDFHNQLNQYLSTMERAEKIHRERVKKDPQGTLDYQTYNDNQEKIKSLQRDYERVMREPFTQKELAYAEMIVNDKIAISELAEGVNKNTVQKIVDVKAPLVKVKKEIAEAKKKIKYDYRSLAREKTTNLMNWKDKMNGFVFNREIPERNLIDIAGKEDGQALVDTYITPVHRSEAARNRYISEKFKKIKELELSPRESELLQQWGEKVIDDNKIIGEGYDIKKIKKADSIFRGIYDEVLEKTNDTLIKNGYSPIEKIDDYYRHFSEDETTPIKAALEKVGFKWNLDKLPTNIAGLTDTFKPGKTWFSSALHRNGDKTKYDAIKGIEAYIQNATDVIYHTHNIQRLRALESEIRYQFSDEYTKEQIDKAYDSGETIEEVLTKINELTRDDKGNLVSWLNQYTNDLANKKLLEDRGVENQMGRWLYSFAQAAERRVGSNMVALNPGSWITNFIPLTQATSQIKTKYIIDSMNDTMRNYSTYDGFSDKSTFLTNRKGYDPLVQTTLEKAIDKATKPMTYIDDFTCQVVTRAKYKQNIDKGMNEDAAIKDADSYAARLIADRSKGAVPLIFRQRNPLTKLFTQFQLEVNNQFSYLFKDMKQYGQDEGAKALAMGLMKLCIGAWLYNNVNEMLTGRRAALDPINIAFDISDDLTNPNISTGTRLKNATNSIVQELPFVGGIMGGGRLPMANALPDIKNVAKYADASENVQKDILKKEGLKSLYWLMPAGGGQLKKVIESADVLKEEGKYKQVNDGEQLQYPVNPTLGNAVKGALFGQYSFPEAREYFDEGNKPLSVKQTSGYRMAMREGIDSDLYIKAIEDIKAIESDKNDKGNTIAGSLGAKKKAYIDALELNPFQKELLYTNFGVDFESEALKKYYEKNLKGMK